MSAPEPQRPAFNPTWVAAGILVLTQLLSIGGSWQAFSDMRTWRVEMEAWRSSTDKRLAEADKTSAVSATEFRKDMEQVKAGIQALQSALMVRQPSVSLSNP